MYRYNTVSMDHKNMIKNTCFQIAVNFRKYKQLMTTVIWSDALRIKRM